MFLHNIYVELLLRQPQPDVSNPAVLLLLLLYGSGKHDWVVSRWLVQLICYAAYSQISRKPKRVVVLVLALLVVVLLQLRTA
jgi:hypothetical protein